MKRTLTTITLTTLFVAISLLTSLTAMAQSAQAVNARNNGADLPESNNCPPAQQFTNEYNTDPNYFSLCISDHGNVSTIEYPANIKHLFGAEGYVACGTANGAAFAASDAGSAEMNWNAPSAVTQPNGPNTFPLTITRQSTNGKFELKQTFDWNQWNNITITMVLKNISNAAIKDVKLARYFNGDLDKTATNDRYDATPDSVWGRQGTATGARHGLMLTALSFALAHSTAVETAGNWAQTGEGCVPMPETVPTKPGNYAGRLTFDLGTLNAGQSKTVKVLYERV
jgi:hypothetical protein